MNTEFNYLYRDGSNNKRHKTVVLAGVLDYDDIREALDEGNKFIPGQVGLPCPQKDWGKDGYEYPTENDHPWCEVTDQDIVPTEAEPTAELTAEELKQKFVEAKDQWDEMKAMEDLGMYY